MPKNKDSDLKVTSDQATEVAEFPCDAKEYVLVRGLRSTAGAAFSSTMTRELGNQKLLLREWDVKREEYNKRPA